LHATICRGPKVCVRNMLDDSATTSHASVASQDSYSIIELWDVELVHASDIG
jgi:hypothetical protein